MFTPLENALKKYYSLLRAGFNAPPFLTRFTIIKTEKGVVLVIALMILALLSVLSLTAVLTTTTDMEISANYKASQTTFYNTEGTMEIAAGIVRRTVDAKSPFPPADSDSDGISDIDETAIISGTISASLDTNRALGDTTKVDFYEFIHGETPNIVPPGFTITVNNQTTTIGLGEDLDGDGVLDTGEDADGDGVLDGRRGPEWLKGFSSEFAEKYDKAGITGMGTYYNMQGAASGDKNSQSQIQLTYRCVERSGGGCL